MENNKVPKKDIFMAGILKENPILTLFLGLCSTLAITTNITNALGMGISVIVILVLSNFIVSLIRNITPDAIRIPVYIVIIATLVKVLELFMQAYVYPLYSALGTFLALIVVNCIILGRAEAFAAKNTPLDSIVDGLGMGIGYTIVIFIISFVRQVLSTGVLSLVNPLTSDTLFSINLIPADFTIPLFGDPAGAFLTFAVLIALATAYQDNQSKKQMAAERAARRKGAN